MDLLTVTQPQCGGQDKAQVGPQPPSSAGGPPEMATQSDSRTLNANPTPKNTSRSVQTPEDRMGLPELPMPSDSRPADMTQTPKNPSRSDQTPEDQMGLPDLATPSNSRPADVTQTPRNTSTSDQTTGWEYLSSLCRVTQGQPM